MMNFNATVNGKPAKLCGKPLIFDDVEQRRKECVAERRKQRILQVREQSKEIARKLRNDVAAEKERQQRKLNDMKAKEIQIWHADAIARAQQNYAACFSQVGAAHYAAKLENEQRAAKAKMRAQQKYCPHVGRPHNNTNRWPLRSCLKKHTMCTQTEPIAEKEKSQRCSPERANKVFIKDNKCSCCPCDSDDDDSSDIFKDGCDISSSDSEPECETVQNEKCNETVIRASRLRKTPAVVLNVDLDCNDVVTITTPGEIKDNFPQNNRQFSSIIRVSPRSKCSGKCDPCKSQPICNPPCSEKTSSENTCSEETSSDTIESKASNKNEVATKSTSTTEVTTRATSITGIEARGSKRFTQVSDLIGKRASKATQMTDNTDNSKLTQTENKRGSTVSNISHTPKLLSTTGYPSNFSLFASTHKMSQDKKEPSTSKSVEKPSKQRDSIASRTTTASKPRDSTTSRTTKNMPKEAVASRVSSQPAPTSPRKEIQSPKTTAKNALLKDKDGRRKSADSVSFQRSNSNDRQLSGRDCISNNSMPVDDCVQFYDYKNKYTKAYEQPCNAVQLQPLIATEPNAMQRARFEKQMRGTRIEKMAQMRKQCEERGQKALEREQVRRDCTELTEKLEALSKQHAPLVPTDANIIGSHHFVDMATKKQARMNAVMEEMLMRPAIITCPEIACPEVIPHQTVTATSKAKSKQPITCLNLGDTPPTNVSEGSDPTSDSCRSILLGYVNDQSKQIRNDISQNKANPQQNKEKSKRLNNLLERIDQLRDALKSELETGTSSSDVHNVQEVIESISNVRKERERILIDGITEEAIVPLQQREKKMQQKEAAKEKDLQKLQGKKDKPTTSGTKTKTITETTPQVTSKSGKPLEIIIKVSGAHIKRTGANAKKSSTRTQAHKSKSPRKVSTLTRSPAKTTNKKPPLTQKKPQTSTTENVNTARNSAAAANIQLDLNSDDSNDSSNAPANAAAQSSYDSNSTAYRSLPKKVTNNVDKVVDKIPSKSKPAVKADDEPTDESADQQNTKQSNQQSSGPPPRLNPLIAHYVQRLLGMSRNSINTLGVSTSEIDTPSSSIINTTANKPEMEEEILSRERIDRVQSFIDENHRLIYELEESLRVSNISDNTLESSMKAFEIIWKQQLMETEKRKRRTEAKTTNSQTILENNEKVLKQRIESQKNRDNLKKSTESEGKQINIEAQRSRSKTKLQETAAIGMESGDIQNSKISSTRHADSSPVRQADFKTQKSKISAAVGDVSENAPQSHNVRFPKHIDSVKMASRQTATDAAIRSEAAQPQEPLVKTRNPAEAAQKSKQLIENPADADTNQRCPDFERYAELTNNCTHRIAELTQLINKVRREKQKILENTLSSVSENERHSTEYMELPDTAPPGDGRCNSEPSTGKLLDSYLINETSAELTGSVEKALPLEKHKSTGRSRDSGISVSRPVTAQELHLDLDPASLASTTNTSHASTRKPKPPPSLIRFSPQLAEDELAHELSTILEVDTPATSRLNATALQTLSTNTPSLQHAYLRSNFPTFEQYIQTLNLDLTQIDAEQSIRIHQEFDELVAALTEAKRNRDLEYKEFPSISAYLQNITSTQERTGDGHRTLSETIPENIEDLLACLRLANLSIKSFPTQSEYVKRIATNTPERDQLDSASLENFTLESGKDPSTESESINIEDELRRRNVLQSSFRRLTRKEEQVFCSTVQPDAERAQSFPPMLIDESGIEKLSTSEAGTAELEKELLGIGLRWHTTMLRKIKETQALSSSSTTTTSATLISATKNMPSARNTPQAANSDSSASIPQKSDDSIQEFGRPLNLRDFLTKELLKQNHTTSTSDSTTDESLRSNFFRSIIGTITPSCKPGQNNSSNNQAVASTAAADRQKTSTPVVSHGTQTGSGSNSSSISISTQLFSGESRLSSVHF